MSFVFANLGLSAIITYSLPVLMFLYPLAIVLILLALFGKFFGNDRRVYCWTIGLTLLAALYDLLRTLPEGLRAGLHLDGALRAVGGVLPPLVTGARLDLPRRARSRHRPDRPLRGPQEGRVTFYGSKGKPVFLACLFLSARLSIFLHIIRRKPRPERTDSL